MQYIIPVSIAVGVLLAVITIGCVCYKRWRLLKISDQRAAEAENASKKPGNVSEPEDEEEPEDAPEQESMSLGDAKRLKNWQRQLLVLVRKKRYYLLLSLPLSSFTHFYYHNLP